MTRGLERNEDYLRLNPESGLGQLADETGGFLVRDTNDATPGFRRIQEDMRFHYLVSYTPTNMSFDGRYRTIAVKVARPNVTVQTRKGYYAVRPEYAMPVRGYEAPALALLDRSPRPDAFAIRLGALSFPENERPGLAPVLVEIPGNTMAWAPERTGGWSHAQFAVVVRIKDARGKEADRLSQEYPLRAAPDKVKQLRAGSVLFYREADLPPGTYTVDAVAYDAIAQTASTRTSTFEVPKASAGGLRLSSLMVVGRAEKLTKEEQDGKNPLQYGEVMLYPNLGTPIRKSVAPVLGFFFSAYGKGAGPGQRATLEIQQGTKVLAKTSTELGALDAQGRSQNAGVLPLNSLAPGRLHLEGVRRRTARACRFARRPSPWWSEAAPPRPGPRDARRGPGRLSVGLWRERARRAAGDPPFAEPVSVRRHLPGGGRPGHGRRRRGPARRQHRGGLTESDFTVLEDGREQQVVSFDVVKQDPATRRRELPDPAPGPVATNVGPAAPRGRTFVIVFDNIHMSPLGARSAKAAVAAFLEKGTRPGDDILLVSTGDNFWWNARAGTGRADLLAVLKDLEGRRFLAPAGDRLTDYEAVQITVYRDVQVAAQVASRFDRYGVTARDQMLQTQQNTTEPGMIDMYVDQRALEAYLQLRNRLNVTLRPRSSVPSRPSRTTATARR